MQAGCLSSSCLGLSCLCVCSEGQVFCFWVPFEKCVFIGYPDGYKAWKFYNLEAKQTVISEHADFDERGSVPHPPPSSTFSSSSSYVPPLLADGLDPEKPHVHVPGGGVG